MDGIVTNRKLLIAISQYVPPSFRAGLKLQTSSQLHIALLMNFFKKCSITAPMLGSMQHVSCKTDVYSLKVQDQQKNQDTCGTPDMVTGMHVLVNTMTRSSNRSGSMASPQASRMSAACGKKSTRRTHLTTGSPQQDALRWSRSGNVLRCTATSTTPHVRSAVSSGSFSTPCSHQRLPILQPAQP